MSTLDLLYHRREPVAWTGGVLVVLSALALRVPSSHERIAPDIELQASVDLPAPPPPPLPMPAPVVPATAAATPPAPRTLAEPTPAPAPVRTVEAVVPAEPLHPQAAPTDTPSMPVAPAAAVVQRTEAPRSELPRVAHEVPKAAVPAAEAAAPAPHLAQQAGYEGTVLAYLEKIKRYPTSREARQSHPTGTVRLWLELARNGQVLGAGVLNSSGSNLLDNEALRTVKAGTFPPFPEAAFPGESTHRFAAGLKYEIGDSN